jgi:hypothetical protein
VVVMDDMKRSNLKKKVHSDLLVMHYANKNAVRVCNVCLCHFTE